MLIKKNKKKYRREKNERGFAILIAVMVSMILLSIGMFIASVAVREIRLSSSAKESQRAFFAADSVLECALFKEFKGGGFDSVKYTTFDSDSALTCNGLKFQVLAAGDEFNAERKTSDGHRIIHIYYISMANPSKIVDTDGDGFITKDEITNDSPETKRYPYVKLRVEKGETYSDESRIKVYGHNYREGTGIIERAIEVRW